MVHCIKIQSRIIQMYLFFLCSGVVVAPHTDSQFVSGKQSLWIDQRWRPSDSNNDKDSNRSEAKLLSNHHLMTGEMTDYAEVDTQNLTTFYNTTNKAGVMQMHPQFLHQYQMQQQQQQQDLTPYATTTLIQQRRPNYVRFFMLKRNIHIYTFH
jgi:hypothetical protein